MSPENTPENTVIKKTYYLGIVSLQKDKKVFIPLTHGKLGEFDQAPFYPSQQSNIELGFWDEATQSWQIAV